MKTRKIGVIGLGHVGAHCAYSLAIQGIADELVLVDQNHDKLVSECQDLTDTGMQILRYGLVHKRRGEHCLRNVPRRPRSSVHEDRRMKGFLQCFGQCPGSGPVFILRTVKQSGRADKILIEQLRLRPKILFKLLDLPLHLIRIRTLPHGKSCREKLCQFLTKRRQKFLLPRMPPLLIAFQAGLQQPDRVGGAKFRHMDTLFFPQGRQLDIDQPDKAVIRGGLKHGAGERKRSLHMYRLFLQSCYHLRGLLLTGASASLPAHFF